jgi:hypothetical protein
VITVVVLGALAAAWYGCGGDARRPAGSGPPAVPIVAPGGSPGTVTAPPAVDANLAYWNGMNSVPIQMAQHYKDGPAAQVRAFRWGASVIREQPTLGIDADLVAWALRMADLLEERAELISRSRNAALLAEAFMRGWNGDPFGVAIELNQAERAWVAACRAHKQEWNRLRAALTARYGVQFP